MSGNLTAHQCQYVIEMLAAMAVGRPVIAYGAGGGQTAPIWTDSEKGNLEGYSAELGQGIGSWQNTDSLESRVMFLEGDHEGQYHKKRI